jgi:hypothetical protein
MRRQPTLVPISDRCNPRTTQVPCRLPGWPGPVPARPMLDQGTPLHVVSEILGHASIVVTKGCLWPSHRGDATLPRLRHDRLGGPMQRGRALFWTVIGSVVAVVAVVIALILVSSGTPPKAASSPVPSISASASSPASKPAPVVIPKTSSTSSFSYLADLTPSGNLGELVNPGPVKIDGSIYPKSILFYCNVGDPTAFPAYKLEHNARRFQATIGLEAKFPPHFEAGVILIGDGRTLRTFSVSVPRPKTVDVNVTGIHTLQLECFGSGQSSSAGWAIAVAWGNARVTERH